MKVILINGDEVAEISNYLKEDKFPHHVAIYDFSLDDFIRKGKHFSLVSPKKVEYFKNLISQAKFLSGLTRYDIHIENIFESFLYKWLFERDKEKGSGFLRDFSLM